jgi:hypothetical protein
VQVAPSLPWAAVELERLESVLLPDIAVWTWQVFLELSAHRSSTGFGPAAISWADLDCWQRVTGAELSAFEREWVFELDRLFLQDLASEAAKRRKGKS